MEFSSGGFNVLQQFYCDYILLHLQRACKTTQSPQLPLSRINLIHVKSFYRIFWGWIFKTYLELVEVDTA